MEYTWQYMHRLVAYVLCTISNSTHSFEIGVHFRDLDKAQHNFKIVKIILYPGKNIHTCTCSHNDTCMYTHMHHIRTHACL